VIGINGDNETNIQASKSLSLTLFNSNNQEISVNTRVDSQKQFDFWIAKDTTTTTAPYTYINMTNSSSMASGYATGFNLTAKNASIHIQIRPDHHSHHIRGYRVWLKFGQKPSENNFDFKKEIAYLTRENDDSFYLVFLNMNETQAFNGYVGILIQDLNAAPNFTSNFWLRIYSAGCYYLNEATNEWSSMGVEILRDTNRTHTHCLSSHLSTFAGGFIVLPSGIDFDYVWSGETASPLKNPTVYAVVCVLVLAYVLMGVLAWRMDGRDEKKLNIILLNGSEESLGYFYEIVVYTGNRLGAATDSKVH
jgi:hypothetical protein